MMQVFVLSVQNAVPRAAHRLGDGAHAVRPADGRDARRHVMGAIVNHGLPPGVSAARGDRDPPAAAGRPRRPRRRAASGVLRRRRASRSRVWVIAVLWVKEQPLRRSLDEVAAVDAAAATPATAAVESSCVTEDFMPLDGWDHVELWVGNAKQAAYYYEQAFGFRRTAYAGPETGVRDRASYVLEQSEIRLVVTSALHPGHEIADHAYKHGDGVKDIALRVPDAARAYHEAVERGARGVSEPAVREDEFGTRRARDDRDVRRRRAHVRHPPRLRGRVSARVRRAGVGERRRATASGCSRSTTSSATSSSAT